MMRFYLAIGWGCLLMVGCTNFEAGAPHGTVDIIAHRGASAYAPENTLAAFELAIEMRADWFELDCTLTQDREVLVIHDDTIDRTTPATGKVSELTLSEIQRHDAGSWFDPKFASERMPTLGQSLDLAKGRIGVYVEIKDSDDDAALKSELLALAQDDTALVPAQNDVVMERIEASGTRNLALTRKVIAQIRERDMQKEAVIQSFSPIVCAIALIEAPDIRTELLATSSDKDAEQWPRFRRWLALLDPPGFNINKNDFTPALAEELHTAGKTIATYTVNDPTEMRALIDDGVDAIITNKPDTLLEVLGR